MGFVGIPSGNLLENHRKTLGKPSEIGVYPLEFDSLLLKMAIEIVTFPVFPSKTVIFHIYVNVYQRVHCNPRDLLPVMKPWL